MLFCKVGLIKYSLTRIHVNTKEKILGSALALFCKKGYYQTTTNEIAQRAQGSIGIRYSYFQDKAKDPEAAATVDRIVFGQNEISRDRLIDAAIDMMGPYFTTGKGACLDKRTL